MQQDVEDQEGNTWRAWLRWAAVSVVSGVVGMGIGYGVTTYLVTNYVRAQPGLDIAGFFWGIIVFFMSMFTGGACGGLFHWLLMRWSLQQAWWVAIKWAFGFLASITLIFFVFPVVNLLFDTVGELASYLIIGAVLGLVISAILGDTRPDRVRRAHGP